MARTPDWDKKAESRISVPLELAERNQKKALVEVWSALSEAGLGLPELAQIFKKRGIDWIQKSSRSDQPKNALFLRQYSTAVAASFGVISASDADLGGYEQVDLYSELISDPNRTILLKVIGKSMIDDGIYPNSLLIVETRDTKSNAWLAPRNGQRVIALVDDTELTVKKFCRKEDGYYYLEPQNRKSKDYQPLRIGEGHDDSPGGRKVEILGIVKSVIRIYA